MAPEMKDHPLSTPITYPRLPQPQSNIQPNHSIYPSNPPPSPGPTTPAASRAATALSTDPPLPAAQAQAAPSIRRPSIEMALPHARLSPVPQRRRATSTNDFSQEEEVRPQAPNTQPEHPARRRFTPVSSVTTAVPDGISSGRLNNRGQPRSLSTIAERGHSPERPESLRKVDAGVRALKSRPLPPKFYFNINNHNTNINNPQPGTNSHGRQFSSPSPSQQPSTRQQPPNREPPGSHPYPPTDKRHPNNIEHGWANRSRLAGYRKSWVKRVYMVWAVTIVVLYIIGVLVWYCLSSQDIPITCPPKNLKPVATNEEFAIDGSLLLSFQQSLANSRVKQADKAVLGELSDCLAINLRDTTNSHIELLSKLHEIFAFCQDSKIPNVGYQDNLLTTLHYHFISALWPWTNNTHVRRRWTALAAASVFKLPIQQLLAAGDSHLDNLTAWESTLQDLFDYLREKGQPGSTMYATVRSLNSDLADGFDASLCGLRRLSEWANGAYNRTRDAGIEVDELEERCRVHGKGCEELSDFFLWGKVFEVLGEWME
ncbi:MAG: hypothetical protein L6R40_008001 [Gallowayella cf. fulva]|nr:MAG: hypothetical protein L6R40_008001 [Xanthomendoza cf. fulva]